MILAQEELYSINNVNKCAHCSLIAGDLNTRPPADFTRRTAEFFPSL